MKAWTMETPSRAQMLCVFVTEDYLIAIGRVITQWSMMEVILDGCIWQASGIRNDIGRIFSAQQQVLSKLDTLGAILVQKHPILAPQFKPVADYVRDCL